MSLSLQKLHTKTTLPEWSAFSPDTIGSAGFKGWVDWGFNGRFKG